MDGAFGGLLGRPRGRKTNRREGGRQRGRQVKFETKQLLNAKRKSRKGERIHLRGIFAREIHLARNEKIFVLEEERKVELSQLGRTPFEEK